MTRRAPGRDAAPTRTQSAAQYNPRSGAGGVFAEALQGATPKYAVNRGFRGDTQHRNTLARMYIRVDAAEYSTFLSSIGDPRVRERLAPRIAGDPTRPREPNSGSSTGYLDFLLQQVQGQFQEKAQVSEGLADNYVAYFFGQTAPIWTYSGILINTVQDDQLTDFIRLYSALLRGTQLARRQKIVSLKYDSFIASGALTGFQFTQQSPNELVVQFSFSLLVKTLHIVNYTASRSPTQAGGAFATDPNAVAYDGRPRSEASLQSIVARTPPGTEETPGPGAGLHPNAATAPPPPVSSPGTLPTTSLPSGRPTPQHPSTSARTSRPETAPVAAPPADQTRPTRGH